MLSLMLCTHVKTMFVVMDDSPFRQTVELGIFISTAGKNTLNLVKW